jgi:hypothetical protein
MRYLITLLFVFDFLSSSEAEFSEADVGFSGFKVMVPPTWHYKEIDHGEVIQFYVSRAEFNKNEIEANVAISGYIYENGSHKFDTPLESYILRYMSEKILKPNLSIGYFNSELLKFGVVANLGFKYIDGPDKGTQVDLLMMQDVRRDRLILIVLGCPENEFEGILGLLGPFYEGIDLIDWAN